MILVDWLACQLGRHGWEIHPFPSRIFEGWKWEALPYLIDDPLIWKMEYEVCGDCHQWRWVFRDEAARVSYSEALRLTFQKAYFAVSGNDDSGDDLPKPYKATDLNSEKPR